MFARSQSIKRYVAEHSPKSFARRIESRNRKLLNALLKIGPKVTTYTHVWINNGCPHCNEYNCQRCLWTTAAEKFALDETTGCSDCCDTEFGGVSYCDVTGEDTQYYWVEYKDCGASLHTRDTRDLRQGCPTPKEEYDNLVAFLKGHIAWAQWECWGKKYK